MSDYYDLRGANFNPYTEKRIQDCALAVVNQLDIFKKDPFEGTSTYHHFDGINKRFLLEIKRTDKDLDKLQTFGYDFEERKMKLMVDWWYRMAPEKQILILLIYEGYYKIENYLNGKCRMRLYPLPIQKCEEAYTTITKFNRGGLPLMDYDMHPRTYKNRRRSIKFFDHGGDTNSVSESFFEETFGDFDGNFSPLCKLFEEEQLNEKK